MKTLIKIAAVFMALLNIGYCIPAPVHADSEASSEAGLEAGMTGRRRGYWRQRMQQQQAGNQQNKMAMMAQRRNGGGGGGGGAWRGQRGGSNQLQVKNWNGGPRKRPTNSAIGNITTAPSTATSPVGSAGTSSATTGSGAEPSIPSAVTNP